MYLLDTNVVSELRKTGTSRVAANVLLWSRSVSESDLYLSVITILELEIGIHRIGRRDPAQGDILRTWMNDLVIPTFQKRVLLVSLEVAKTCATLHVPNKRPENDALIAATALVHNLTIVTRNTSDFTAAGVPLLNPWDPQP